MGSYSFVKAMSCFGHSFKRPYRNTHHQTRLYSHQRSVKEQWPPESFVFDDVVE